MIHPVSFDENALFVVTKLLRPGEEAVGAWPVNLCWFAKGPLGVLAIAAWVSFVEDRYASWMTLLRTGSVDDVPVGWGHAAVRLYGGEARVALSGVALPPWRGPEEAESFLRVENDGLCRLRRPWERG